MWCIQELADAPRIEAVVVLDTSQFGQGLPKGFDGQEKEGFSFFELNEVRGGAFVEGYITSRITSIPVLAAVTDEQYNNWRAKKIIARAALFTYDEQAFERMMRKTKDLLGLG